MILKLTNHIKQWILFKRFLSLIDKTKKRQGLNILTPIQIFSRLPISLARLNAVNNPEQLKNEIRQRLCSY